MRGRAVDSGDRTIGRLCWPDQSKFSVRSHTLRPDFSHSSLGYRSLDLAAIALKKIRGDLWTTRLRVASVWLLGSQTASTEFPLHLHSQAADLSALLWVTWCKPGLALAGGKSADSSMTGERSQGTDDLKIVAQEMDEGTGDKRPGADEVWEWAGGCHTSAGLSSGKGSRQRVWGALRRQLEDSGRQVSRSLIETFPQALHWRVWCLCLCDNECVKCVRACLCE